MLVDTSDSLVVVILESSANNPVVFSLRSMVVLVGRAKLLKAGEGRENARRLGAGVPLSFARALRAFLWLCPSVVLATKPACYAG